MKNILCVINKHRWSVHSCDGRRFCGRCSKERPTLNRVHDLSENCWCDPEVIEVEDKQETHTFHDAR